MRCCARAVQGTPTPARGIVAWPWFLQFAHPALRIQFGWRIIRQTPLPVGHVPFRWGVSYIINKYVGLAKQNPLFNIDFPVTPHVFRHSKAMHLLQADVNLIYIRDFLGHVDVVTTEVYARADSEMKRKALENAYVDLVTGDLPKWDSDGGLLKWLNNLCN